MERTAISARVIADSLSVATDIRLTTMVLTYPLFIHNELMTHRTFSRNAASSRAIPIKKMIEMALTDTAMPVSWRQAQAGMQPAGDLDEQTSNQARYTWAMAAQDACQHARTMEALGVAKEITNRLLGPFLWMTTIVTATDWANFFHLRCHREAQKEFQVLAQAACAAYFASRPEEKEPTEWHLPFVTPEDLAQCVNRWADTGTVNDNMRLISVGRCARVSYLTHEGVRDIQKDIELADRLKVSGHWSPYEHVAMALGERSPHWSGNFKGWAQFRKWFNGENMATLLGSPEEYASRA